MNQLSEIEVVCEGEKLSLTNQRAIFWQKKKMLIVSDLHIGKTAHFRKNGIPISVKVLQRDLERLQILIDYYDVKHVMIVGDLFHAEANKDIEIFNSWLEANKDIKITLIKGNHDRLSKTVYEKLNIDLVAEALFVEPFYFSHEYIINKSNQFFISGHIHPGIIIKGKGKQRIKLPTFQITNTHIVLPAFSLFTGLNTKSYSEKCKHYAFTDKEIFLV